ncbi:MAG: tetratricopeptide repeat protein [Minicystis sp.]
MPRPTNLTALPTSFIGRAGDLRALAESLDRSRLVTVLGPPGTGKTRLAKQHARAVLAGDAPLYEGGVFFCDLSEATTVEGVVARIAPLVGVDLADSLPIEEAKRRLGAALRACGPVLLILDNFEQLVRPAAHVLPDFVAAADEGTRFLVTSRERLGVAGEALFDLGPLTLPEEGGPSPSEAVDLFIERARAVSHTFQPSDRELSDIRKLVRLLDGLPLAIELAAARTRVLAPAELIDRLSRRFALLTHDPSTLRARRATLWETIEASWSMLPAWEQAALAQVSAFRGGFGVDAAEEVIDLGRFPEAPPPLDVLTSLRDKSLILGDERETSARRFTLLASIREFGEAKLDEAEARAVHARHACHYLGLGADLGARIEARDDAEARRRLRLEHENFMAVHQRFLARKDGPGDLRGASLRAALVLARSASAYPYAFCLGVLDAALAAADEREVGPALLARALEARGDLRRFVGQTHESIEDFERVRALATSAGDRALVARALSGLGNAATVRARWREARGLFEEAIAVHVETGDRRAQGRVLAMLAATRFNEDEPEAARAVLARALDLQRASGDRAFEGISVTSLGIVTLAVGALSEARTHLAEGLRIHREVGARHWEGVTLGYAALVEQEAGRDEEAHRLYEQAITLLREINVRRAEGLALAGWASLLLGEGRLDEAKDRYRRALDSSRAMSPDHEGLLLGCLAAVAALEGDLTTAADTFACADLALAPHTRPSFAAAIDVHRGQLDLARARAAAEADRPALVAAARARIDRAAPWAAVSTDVRFARRLLEKSLAAVATEAPPVDAKRALVVGPSGLWFKPPRAKESVHLHRRRSLQRLVHELAEHRLRAPGEAIRIPELIACGWPGERILPEAGTERVYTAVATLRKLGLRKLLLQRDDGYLLDPDVGIVRSRSNT